LIFGEFLPLKETLVWASLGIAEKTAQNFKMWQNFPQELFSTKKCNFSIKKDTQFPTEYSFSSFWVKGSPDQRFFGQNFSKMRKLKLKDNILL
jgi:hypothetical protein